MVDKLPRCTYGKPSIYDAQENCVTRNPEAVHSGKWCAWCLHREFIKQHNRLLDIAKIASGDSPVATEDRLGAIEAISRGRRTLRK